ncbi:MAG: BamA/TamA family outer membrane protein [Prevotella sp.]|nr:BamA/TamA family outer membrane protein [Prevotella sp.]
MKEIRTALLLGVALLAAACSETRYVADGQLLLNRVRVRTDSAARDASTAQLKSYIRQKPNARWFSLYRVPLGVYSLSGCDTTRWINRTLRSMGEAPVIFDERSAQQTAADLQMQMQNWGYLRSTVEVSTRKKGKKVNVTYVVHPNSRYHIRTMRYEIGDSTVKQLLHLDDSTTWRLKPVMAFEVDLMDRERKRIVQELQDNGYFHFHRDFVSYRADSVAGQNAVDLTLVLHKYRRSEGGDTLHPRYRIGAVTFGGDDTRDSAVHLRRRVLLGNTFVVPGDYYSARGLQNTYTHFGRLQAVKYTSISFKEHTDTALLDCHIQLSTNKPSTVSFLPEGTNTAGDLGAAVTLAYQNRNLFRGSENLSVELRGAFEAIKGLEGYANDNFEEYSAEAKLSFPRFIAPFLPSGFRRRINATSEVSLLYDLQNRPEFHRRVFSVAWRYRWNDANHHDRYQIDLLDLNYIFMPWISQTFREEYLDGTSNRNAILRYNYEDLFIMKWGFGYTYNNGSYALKANVETAGNLLNWTAPLLHLDRNAEGQRKLLGIAFAQYVKGDFDYTRNLQLDGNNALVLHAGFGIAYPYGNSRILPFEKRYFSGGANSVRGWSVRSLGPGGYVSRDGKIDFINQTGDMKLDLNMEYRAHLFWKLNGALFIDAGNIWTLRNYADQPEGQFKLDEFWKQIAVSYGWGIRFNFDYFILRFDMGMKAVNPAYSTSHEHYPLVHPRLSRDFAFHFAVGLPF